MSSVDILSEAIELGRIIEEPMYTLLTSKVSEPFAPIVLHQAKTGGKRIRPAFTLLFAQAAGGLLEQALYGAVGVELIHTYSLIVDDIIDVGDIRRNTKTTRALYSDEMALLSSMIYRETIYDCILKTSNPQKIEQVFSETIRKLIEGERMDVLMERRSSHEYFQKNSFQLEQITEDTYMTMISMKTACLFSCAAQIGTILAGGSLEQINTAIKFGELAGLAFQIVDDILDLTGDEKQFGKQIGKDILESKLGNFPLFKAFQSATPADKNTILAILQSKNASNEDIRRCLQIIEKYKGFEIARKKAKELIENAKNLLINFPNMEKTKYIGILADYIIERII